MIRVRRLLNRWSVGNRHLTAVMAAILLLLLGIEGATLQSGSLLTVHAFVGMLLIPLVALKLASAGWRMLRYYMGAEEYVRHGPPHVALRVFVAPVIVLATVVLFGTGVGVARHRAGPMGPWSVCIRRASSCGSAQRRCTRSRTFRSYRGSRGRRFRDGAPLLGRDRRDHGRCACRDRVVAGGRPAAGSRVGSVRRRRSLGRCAWTGPAGSESDPQKSSTSRLSRGLAAFDRDGLCGLVEQTLGEGVTHELGASRQIELLRGRAPRSGRGWPRGGSSVPRGWSTQCPRTGFPRWEPG